ncbi:MAG: hypothetical protein ACK417_05455 [Bacteroidia bacterium]
MKRNHLIALFGVVVASILFSACKKEEPPQIPVDPTPPNAIVGNWISVRTNVAPFFRQQPLNADSVWARFTVENTYQLKIYDAQGVETANLGGTWSATASGYSKIYNVVLSQTQPDTRRLEGIFEVYTASPDSMKLEFLQTAPELPNFNGPNAQAGFGSSTGPGFQPGTATHRFRRLP